MVEFCCMTNKAFQLSGCGKGLALGMAIKYDDSDLERHREKQHLAYLHLEKASDRVPYDVIWYALRWYGVPEELIEWLRTYNLGHTSSDAIWSPRLSFARAIKPMRLDRMLGYISWDEWRSC
ncbi:hypothetical protein Y032_0647g1096 [Ancylostoma ceylanicum]|uniref:Uncharacterized protein n=1 Tax=Ancylostoma ceylanicum TaxID=53326 RepID=A0A016WKV1_9BILA|nr:hypothetical protein Y032_0647g1096 [Ancylostoma ceylanicum]